MTGSVTMMPYQVYQLYQAERTKTAAENRRADEQLGELSRALSSVWQHATRPKAVLRALAGTVAGTRPARPTADQEPVRPRQRTQPRTLRRADYLTGYHPSSPSGTPSAPSDRPDERAA
jgi:hypothetical protein